MVKINKTLGLALLTALAASCSSDNDVAGTSNPTIENGEANYATLKIDLPTRAGVRAVDFKDADGLKDEYKVNDATLLVFKKGTGATSENEYTFVEKVDLGNMTWTDPSATSITGVTTSANVTAELKKATIKDLKDGNIYGLVILNNVTKDGKGTKITIPAEGTKYSEWNVPGSVTTDANKVANMTDISKGIVMANAPEWTTSGQAPTTLVWIHGDKVKPTKAQAEAAGAAADIHVERGLAKVTLAQYGKDNTIPVDDKSTYNDFTVKLDAWALDVTNKTSFPIHKTDGLAESRKISRRNRFSLLSRLTPKAFCVRFIKTLCPRRRMPPTFSRLPWRTRILKTPYGCAPRSLTAFTAAKRFFPPRISPGRRRKTIRISE